jgi:S-DNA-T family DNA segregation ATPase FtsK/SpoIIIE
VATKQQSRSKTRSGSSAARSKSPAKPAARKPAAKTTARKPAAKAAPRATARYDAPASDPIIGPAIRAAFDGHGHDVWGVAFIVVGIVMGLGLYADLAGPLGRFLGGAGGAAVGKASYLLPLAFVALGAMLMRGPRTREDDGENEDGEIVGVSTSSQVRLLVGSVLVLVSSTGLLHLAGGKPAFGSPLEGFIDAGGYLGALTGLPLERLVAVWGAGLIIAAIGVIGLVIITDTSLGVVMGRTAQGMRPTTSAIRRGWDSMFELRSVREGYEYDDDADDLIDLRATIPPAVVVAGADDGEHEDETAVEEIEAVAKPKRSRKKEPEAPTIHLPEMDDAPIDAEQLAIDLGPAAKASNWKLPPMSLLARSEAQEIDATEVEELGHTLEAALAAHGVETRLVGMVVGPTVTRYELELGPGVKVARVTSLNKDIAYAMASSDVRILAPIPGRQAIGVEVPNKERQVVAVADILASEEARKASHPLEVAIGRDINGRSVLINLATMPHVLIAGATGAGKSSCINSLITSILMRSTPDQVRMILIDPKRVELGQYNKLPHLLTQVVTNPKKAANALAWAVREMERRYDLLAEVGFRDINGYNAAYDRGDLKNEAEEETGGPTFERLPYIIVVVDELNDLMMVAARDVEDSICRIAQMARAVGVHLVIATQRPSVNVITGVIKANVPARLAFAVSSLADSRVILDQPGAERLVGKGDLLLLGPSSSVAQRIQGCWVSEKEVRAVVGNWIRQAPDVQYLEGVEGDDGSAGTAASGIPGGSSGDDDDDELLRQAIELIVRSQLGSTSMLQRKLRVGFARAGRLMDLLEQRGVVGPSEGSKARAVLMTPEELDEQNGAGE